MYTERDDTGNLCQNCDSLNRAWAVFCGNCGRELREFAAPPRNLNRCLEDECGQLNAPKASYCCICGHPLLKPWRGKLRPVGPKDFLR